MFSQFTYQFLLNTVVFSTLVLIVAWVLAILYRKSAATVFACSFGGLLFAFLVPAFCLLGNSVNKHHVAICVDTGFIPDAIFQQPQPSLQFSVDKSVAPKTDSTNGNVDRVASDGQVVISALPKSSSESRRGINSLSPWLLLDIAIAVCVITSVALLLRLFAALIGTLQIFRKSDLVNSASHPEQQRLIVRLREDRITIRSVRGLRSPVAIQWPERAILMPDNFLFEMSAETIDRVIEHERAHILRCDHATLIIQEAIVSVLWFNPLVHVVKRIVDQSREDVCDNWVLVKSNSSDYCRDLVDLSESASNVHVLAPGFTGSRAIGTRIRSLLNESRIIQVSLPRPMGAIVGTLLLAVGSIAFFTSFSFAQSRGGKPEPAQFSSISFAKNKETRQEPDHLTSKEILELVQGFSNPKTLFATVFDRETGEPIADANVKLLDVSQEQTTLGTVKTNMAGEFEFHDLDQHQKNLNELNLVLLVSHHGHSSQIIGLRNSMSYLQSKQHWQIELGKPSTLTGRITDKDGKPIAGVNVWQPMFLKEPVGGILQCYTGADGRYEIKDHHEFNARNTRRDLGNGVSSQQSGTLMMVRHPQYGRTYFNVPSIPGNADLQLEKAMIVIGRAIDKVTGKPLPGLTVTASGHDHESFENTITSADGKFEMALNPTTPFNIWVRHPKLDTAAQEISGASGQTFTTKDFELESLVTVKGRVLDDRSGKPFKSKSIETFVINWYGDARPATTSECKSAPIKKDGTFELKVLPGKIAPYIGSHSLIDVAGRTYKDGLIVTRDKPIELEFRVREREDTP